MSEFKASGFSDEFGNAGPDLVGITTFTSPYYFVPPSGSTEERPSSPPPGMLRFNTDIGRLEVWRNDHWATILGESSNLGDQNNTNSSGGTGTRGLFAGGNAPDLKNEIEYISISTLGNSQDFGDLTAQKTGNAGCSSRTRGIFANGVTPSRILNIDFVTIASTGNAEDFGDSTISVGYRAALSNSTRGVIAGGELVPGATTDVIDYITIASAGVNAIDFGDLAVGVVRAAPCASAVRGVYMGGSGPAVDTIQYLTISTTGNTQDFGDLVSTNSTASSGLSNSTRGIIGAMRTPGYVNTMEFITIASTGNAQDFGDQTDNRGAAGPAASSTRGVFAAGYGTPANRNTIDFVTILTTGNAQDFGDLTYTADQLAGCSNGHGGL